MADGLHLQDAAACTRALEQKLTLRPVQQLWIGTLHGPVEKLTPEQQRCTGAIECKQHYSLKLINCSAGGTADRLTNATALRTQHARAKAACETRSSALPSGGWCLTPRVGQGRDCSGGQYDTGCMVRVRASSSHGVSSSYFLPRMHFVPDGRVLALIDRLLRPDPAWPRPSLVDIGAGVGQFCSSLLGIDSRRDCRSYDGAGNVQAITGDHVKWADLSAPLSVPRAQWVLSVEVGEHIPNQLEPMLIRNLHASNCRGIILSWGAYYPGMRAGHEDVNYHSKRYLVDVFERLGYRYRADLTEHFLTERTRPRHPWFDHNMVGVLERWTPLVGDACS